MIRRTIADGEDDEVQSGPVDDGDNEERNARVNRWRQIFKARYLTLIFGLSLGLIAWTNLSPLILIARVHWRAFSSAHFSYSESRYAYQKMIPGLVAQRILPEDAVLEVRPADRIRSIDWVGTRYLMYPLRLAEHGNFILAYGQAREEVPGDDLSRAVTSTATLYARPGQSFLARPRPITDLSLPATVAAAISFAALNIFVGWLALCGLGVDFRSQGGLWAMSICYLLGFLILTGVVWIYLLFLFPVSTVQIVVLWAGILVGGWRWIRRRGCTAGYSCLETMRSRPGRDPGLLEKIRFGMRLAGAGGYVLLWVIAILVPVVDWDGLSHWILKAKILAHEHALIFDYSNRNQYPLLWPLNIAIQFMICGSFDQLAQWTGGWLFLVFACQLHKGMRTVGAPLLVADLVVPAFVLAWAIVRTPNGLFLNFGTSNAENLFLAYFSALLVVVLIALRDGVRRPVMWLAIALAVGVSLSKIEGAVVVVFVALGLLVLLRQGRDYRAGGYMGLGILGTVVFPLLWTAWIDHHGYGGQFVHFAEWVSLSKTILLSQKYFHYIATDSLVMINMLFMFFWGVGYRFGKWSDRDIFLGIVALGLIFFAWFSNVGWTMSMIENMNMEVVPRLFLHAAPAILFFWASRTMSGVIWEDQDRKT